MKKQWIITPPGDYSYFPQLTPREQLNDLIHKVAKIKAIPYGIAWRRFFVAYAREHGPFPEGQKPVEQIAAGNNLPAALAIAHEMTGNIIPEQFRQ